jgi:hypothetical protein
MTAPITPPKVTLTDRVLCWVAVISIQLLTTANVFANVPNNHMNLVVKAALEVLSILLFFRINAGEVGRDLIDLSLYELAVRLFVLWAYFFSPAYKDYADAPTFLATNMFFLAALARLLWCSFHSGRYALAEWPVIGPYGMVWRRNYTASVTGASAYFRVVATLIISAEIAAIFLAADFGIYQALPACIGIGLLWQFARPVRQEVVDTVQDGNEQADRIDQLEDIIELAGRKLRPDLFENLPPRADMPPPPAEKTNATVTPLRVVPREPKPPDGGDKPENSGQE